MLTLNDKTALVTILSNPAGKTEGFPNSKIIHKMLEALYARQTSDEQASGATRHDNSIGFSGCDSEFLSDVAAKTAVKRDFFSPKQCAAVAKCLKRYTRQLIEIAEEKMRANGIVIPEKVRRSRKAAVQHVAKELPLIPEVEHQIAELRDTDIETFTRDGEMTEEEALAYWRNEFANRAWTQSKNEFAQLEREQEEAAYTTEMEEPLERTCS